METEELKALAATQLKAAREYLSRHDEYDPQLVTVHADNEMDCYVIVHPPVPPRVVVRQLLRKRPATAFILTSEAWTIRSRRTAGESTEDFKRRIKRQRAAMPANLSDYHGPDRTECLMLWVCSRDYVAMHQVPFRREGKTVHFEAERVATPADELIGAFVEMRELLQYLH